MQILWYTAHLTKVSRPFSVNLPNLNTWAKKPRNDPRDVCGASSLARTYQGKPRDVSACKWTNSQKEAQGTSLPLLTAKPIGLACVVFGFIEQLHPTLNGKH